MKFLKIGLLFSASTLSKLFAGLFIVKIIAITVGAEGLGRLGQFMSLMSMVTILAGGGIATGIIKYVSEFKNDAKKLNDYLAAACFVSLTSTLIVGVGLYLGAEAISVWLFKTADYRNEIRMLALVQFFIALANLLFGLVNGHQRVKTFAAISVASVLLGVGGVALASSQSGMSGAMYGLMWMSACPVIFLLPWFKFGLKFQWRQLMPAWHKEQIRQFGRFALMLLVSVLTMQMAQVIIRILIESNANWVQVGYWQAVSKVSDAYLQFITVVLANYFLPRLSEIRNRVELKSEVRQAYMVAMPALFLMAIMVFLCRDWIILIVFSKEFLPMKDFFTFQLIGDCFKIAAYIGAYVAIAKAKTKLYIAAELLQSVLLVFLCAVFVRQFGAIGATYAYCLNYIFYFLVVAVVLRNYLNRQDAV